MTIPAENLHIPCKPTTLTWTGISTLRSCQLRFKRKYVERRGEPSSAPLERGSGVHAVLEDLGRAKYEKRELDDDAVQGVIEKHLAPLPVESAEDARGIINTVRERDLLPEFPDDATDVGFEFQFALRTDGTPCAWDDPEAAFRSIWDQVFRENGGTLAVVRDFKTNWVIENPADQMRLYAWAPACIWPEVEEVVVELHFVRFGAIRKAVHDADTLRANVPSEIQALLAVVHANLESDAWEARVSSDCNLCGFHAQCPAMKVGTSLPKVTSTSEAAEAANELLALSRRKSDIESALKTWCGEHGNVQVGEEVVGFVAKTRRSVDDVKKLGRILKKRGVADAEVFAALTMPSGNLSKLVTKAISDTPRKERGHARKALMELFEKQGIFAIRTHTELKRYRPESEEPDSD